MPILHSGSTALAECFVGTELCGNPKAPEAVTAVECAEDVQDIVVGEEWKNGCKRIFHVLTFQVSV